MSKNLILPKHVAATAEQSRQASMMSNLGRNSRHRIDSDEFVTLEDVSTQLGALQQYLTDRREEQPDYQLPQPTGWKLMVLIMTISETSQGGVIMVDDARQQRSLSSPQGVVLAVGPAAYSDPDRFMVNGELQPWCVPGDRITLVKYDASMYQLPNGQHLGFANDTQPVAVIDRKWELPK